MKHFESSAFSRPGILILILLLSASCLAGNELLSQQETSLTQAKAEIRIQAEEQPTTQQHNLIIRSTDGVVGIFDGDDLIYKTDIPVISLPNKDRKELEQGITVKDEQALHQLLEDLGS